MQSLWTRVAQVRGSCRCPQCVSSAQAVTRRATASATRRVPRYTTSSTLFYSTILGVAATIDTGLKIQRRERWDQAIADVKKELDQPEEMHHSQPAIEEAKEYHGTKIGVDGYEPFAALDSHEKLPMRSDYNRAEDNSPLLELDAAKQQLEANLDSSRYRKHIAQFPVSTQPDARQCNFPPQSIYAHHGMKRQSDQSRWTPGKLERVTLNTDRLLLGIFDILQKKGWSKEAALAVPDLFAEKMLMSGDEIKAHLDQKVKDVTRLRMEGFEGFRRSENDLLLGSYLQDDLGEFHNITRNLNRTLRELFKLGEKKELRTSRVIGRVCYNLAASTAPPNVDTYNTLMVGFSQLDQPSLVAKTIHAFKKSGIRPNEVSLAFILDHWTTTNAPDLFHKWVKLIRGEEGGLMGARPDININEASQGRVLRIEGYTDLRSSQAARHHVRMVQLPHPTPMVFDALIRGVLKFNGFQTALDVCEGMAHENWGLDMTGLGPLLKDCAERGDWSSGLAVWKQIQALKWKSRRRQLNGKWFKEKISIPTFVSMLRLCVQCKQKNIFSDIMEQAVQTYPSARQQVLKLLKSDSKASKGQEYPYLGSEFANETMQAQIAAKEANTQFMKAGNRGNLEPSSSAIITNHNMRLEPDDDVALGSDLSLEQLHGNLPASEELDDYEIGERPLSITTERSTGEMFYTATDQDHASKTTVDHPKEAQRPDVDTHLGLTIENHIPKSLQNGSFDYPSKRLHAQHHP